MVVVVGETETEPPATGVTEPTPLLIEMLVALAVAQVRVVELPAVIVVGLADSEPVITVTVAARVIGAPAPAIVAVYVVVVVGETEIDPPAIGVTEPMPLSIEMLVALVVDHDSVVESPVLIDAGLADKDPVWTGLTVTVAVRVVVPPTPVKVAV